MANLQKTSNMDKEFLKRDQVENNKGRVISGEWHKGELKGRVTIEYSNGDLYEGMEEI
jgi:hypothetical protein